MAMIPLNNTLVSDEILNKEFVCNLAACEGRCCVEGDFGAPLEKEEIELIQDNLDLIKPYMTKANRQKLEKEGIYEKDPDGDMVTKCMNGADCIFVRREADGIYKCTIERAWEDGKLDFQKPVSCHLYPVRIEQNGPFTTLEYDKAEMCDPACALGKSLQVPIYQFIQNALIRKFGEDWYNRLDELADNLRQWKAPER